MTNDMTVNGYPCHNWTEQRDGTFWVVLPRWVVGRRHVWIGDKVSLGYCGTFREGFISNIEVRD